MQIEIITQAACAKNKLTFIQGLALIAIGTASEKDFEELVKNGYITYYNSTLRSLNQKFTITHKGADMIHSLLDDSNEEIVSREEAIERLAGKLKEIYPKGKMIGTSYYYRSNKTDVVRKLKSFFNRYGQYTDEQVIEATEQYVKSFNGNYTYLKLLKYFIWKEEIKDGEVLVTSQLADWIENGNQTNTVNNDWTATLV